jgi:hypothetical protein
MNRTVYTDIRTMAKAKTVLNDLGLRDIIDNPKNIENLIQSISILSILDQIFVEENSPLAEFLTIITKDDKTDWYEIQLSEIKDIITRFFDDIISLLPKARKEPKETQLKSK